MTLKNDRYAYRVIWSNSDQEYVGLCTEFSTLSWLAQTPEAAWRALKLWRPMATQFLSLYPIRNIVANFLCGFPRKSIDIWQSKLLKRA